MPVAARETKSNRHLTGVKRHYKPHGSPKKELMPQLHDACITHDANNYLLRVVSGETPVMKQAQSYDE